MIFVGMTGKLPTWVFASFFLGAVMSIGTIWWSMRKTEEVPPTAEEIAKIKAEPLNLLSPFKDIISAIGSMPKVMWQLAAVYLFQWYALFCYWQNSSKSVALSVWELHLKIIQAYGEAVSWTGLVNGWYNIVTFLTAFLLVRFAKNTAPRWSTSPVSFSRLQDF